MTRSDADLDLAKTAALLDLPEQAILRWAEKGALPADTSRGAPRFAKDDVLDWARHMGMRLPEAIEDRGRVSEPNALAASLRRGVVLENVAGSTPREVLADAVNRLPDLVELGLHNRTREGLLELLLTRESLASTAVGDGFAVPHCRSPIGSDLAHSVTVLGRLAKPVDWNALDGGPVDTVLVVLSPNLEFQLELLRRVALALRSPEVRDLVRAGQPLPSVCDAIEAVPE